MNTRTKHQVNVRLALILVLRFGWIRGDVLGTFMWPGKKSSSTMGLDLAKKLVDAGLVLVRKLPNGAGRVFVLSLAGAQKLTNEVGPEEIKKYTNLKIQSGKDLGSFSENGEWKPTKAWMHHLWTQMVIAWIYANPALPPQDADDGTDAEDPDLDDDEANDLGEEETETDDLEDEEFDDAALEADHDDGDEAEADEPVNLQRPMFKTEREIKAATVGESGWKNMPAGKLPDGFIIYKDPDGNDLVYWLEVERAHKSGQHMEQMIKAAKVVSLGNVQYPICGYLPSKVLFAFSCDATEPNGTKINHHPRIMNAFQVGTTTPTIPNFLEFEQRGSIPNNMRWLPLKTIHPDRIKAKLKELNALPQLTDIKAFLKVNIPKTYPFPRYPLSKVVEFSPDRDSSRVMDYQYIDVFFWRDIDGGFGATMVSIREPARGYNREGPLEVTLMNHSLDSFKRIKTDIAEVIVLWLDAAEQQSREATEAENNSRRR